MFVFFCFVFGYTWALWKQIRKSTLSLYITTQSHIIRIAKQNDIPTDNDVYEILPNQKVGKERKDLKTNYQNLKETENHCPLVFQNILNSRHVKEGEAEGMDNERNQNKMDKVHEECLLNGYKMRWIFDNEGTYRVS